MVFSNVDPPIQFLASGVRPPELPDGVGPVELTNFAKSAQDCYEVSLQQLASSSSFQHGALGYWVLVEESS